MLNTVETNGTVKIKRNRKVKGEQPVKGKRRAAKSKTTSTLAMIVTVSMGIGIPALTLALTTVSGRLLLKQEYLLAGAILAVCGTVLAVSLHHLKSAVCDITKSGPASGWLLAVAIDLSVVLSEVTQVVCPNVTDGLAFTIMLFVTIASMILNVWAFLRHK